MAKNRKKCLEVHVGDVVTVVFDYPRARLPSFDVRVLSVHDRGPYDPLIEYERIDGVAESSPQCSAWYVERVVVPAPYKFEIKKRENVFADIRSSYLIFSVGGVKYGSLRTLMAEALSGVTKFSLRYPLDEDKAEALFNQQGKPGIVALPEEALQNEFVLPMGMVAVRWKVFRKWVHRNALRLIETKRENHRRILKEDARIAERDSLDYQDLRREWADMLSSYDERRADEC